VNVMDSDTKKYWNVYYESFDEVRPSPFCSYVMHNFLDVKDTVLELGCGNGRDGLSLARNCTHYQGFDVSKEAIHQASLLFDTQGLQAENYELLANDFSSVTRPTTALGRVIVYSRFSLHADSETVQQSLFNRLNQTLHKGDLLLIEVRTIYDELYGVGTNVDRNAYISDHYRRFLDPGDFPALLPNRLKVLTKLVERGFAPYAGADPKVMRLFIEVSDDA
jgi:cyclopropane fatty-acyl-phospholipid synthase-like methyltransferase